MKTINKPINIYTLRELWIELGMPKDIFQAQWYSINDQLNHNIVKTCRLVISEKLECHFEMLGKRDVEEECISNLDRDIGWIKPNEEGKVKQ